MINPEIIYNRAAELELTLAAIAKEAGISPQALSNCLRRKSMSAETMSKVAKVLEISVSQLIDDTPAALKEEEYTYTPSKAEIQEVNDSFDCIPNSWKSNPNKVPTFKNKDELLAYRQRLIDRKNKEIEDLKRELDLLRDALEDKKAIIEMLRQKIADLEKRP